MEEKVKDTPTKEKCGNPWALLPIAAFLVIYMGVSIIFNDFYLMSVVVGLDCTAPSSTCLGVATPSA